MIFEIMQDGFKATFNGIDLKLSTGVITRHWKLTPQGFATTFLGNSISGSVFSETENQEADWKLNYITTPAYVSKLKKISAQIVEQNSCTNKHLLIQSYFEVDTQQITLCYSISAFAGIGGIRTEVSCKALEGYKSNFQPSWLLESYSERLPLNSKNYTQYLAGYYNDTQHRYHQDLKILKEEVHKLNNESCQVYDWANLIALEDDKFEGLILLKESHKCVNQSGIDTGNFKVYPDCVVSTGLGLKSHYEDPCLFSSDGFSTCWANWCLVYSGGELGRQEIIKKFDSQRFPFRPKRDALVTSNTWGSRGSGEYSRAAANEKDVLLEIERAAKLGIDCVQIDDGWQIADDSKDPYSPTQGWRPAMNRFSCGWSKVKERADELGIKLGIWFPHFVSLKDMIENIRAANFKQIKIDFVNATSRAKLDDVFLKAKAISELSDDIQVNFDLTEQAPRFGYYYGREFCSLFPQNIEISTKNKMGVRHITYEPWVSLRQSWHYAKYLNLKKMQLSLQNVDEVNPEFSEASEHSHEYCFATTMFGLPLFFLETKFYNNNALQHLQPVVNMFRKHRTEIYRGIVYPIGDEPDNKSITGFQSHTENTGYLLVFRELHAKTAGFINVNFLAGKDVWLKDVFCNEEKKTAVTADGKVPIHIPQRASWKMLRYKIVK